MPQHAYHEYKPPVMHLVRLPGSVTQKIGAPPLECLADILLGAADPTRDGLAIQALVFCQPDNLGYGWGRYHESVPSHHAARRLPKPA